MAAAERRARGRSGDGIRRGRIGGATAAISAPPRPSALLAHLSPSSRPLSMCVLPFLRRHVNPLTTTYAVRQDAPVWNPAPVSAIGAATVDGSVFQFHVVGDLSDTTELADSYVAPGQYLQVRVPAPDGELKLAFMAVTSTPGAGPRFEFLVKSVPWTTAERLCRPSAAAQATIFAAAPNSGWGPSPSPKSVAVHLRSVATGNPRIEEWEEVRASTSRSCVRN